MKRLATCFGFLLMALGMSHPAFSQSITSYESTIFLENGSTTTAKPLTIPATAVACSTGRAPAAGTVWLLPTDTFKLQWEPDETRVCVWQGPASSTLGLSTGTLYRFKVAAINEAGQKGDPSPMSNPFGIAGKPATIQRVYVGPGT